MLPQAWLTDAWTLPLWSVLSPGSEECLGGAPETRQFSLCPPFPPGLGVLQVSAPQLGTTGGHLDCEKMGEPSAIVFGAGTGDPQVFLSLIL